MEGHVKLGPYNDIRPYLINSARSDYTRANANQMADKLGTGAGDYSDLTSWTAHTEDDWQAGIGKRDVDAGGMLYSESETRYPNRLQLPLALVAANQADATNFALNTGYAPGVLKAESTMAIGTTQTYSAIAKAIKGNGTKLIGVHILLNNSDAVDSWTIALFSSTGSPAVPNSAIRTVVEYSDSFIGYTNHYITFDDTLTNGTTYHIVVYPTTATQTMNIAVDTSGASAADLTSVYNGSAWTGAYTGARFLMEPVMSMPVATAAVSKMIYFPATGYMYAAAGAVLYRQTDDTAKWVTLHTLGATITDLFTDGSVLFIGLGDVTAHVQMISDETLSTPGTPVAARLFCSWSLGYLWRAINNVVYRTSDGATWSGPFEICPTGFAINGMAGQGDYLFVSCDDALYYVGYGDAVYVVTPWGQLNPAEKFGANMVNWQGSLYIPIAQGIIRSDASAMLPVGPDLGEGLPLFRSGNIGGLATQNNWLYCTVIGTGGASSVWAYNGQGWHFVAVAPTADLLYFTSIYYNRKQQRLYLGTNAGAIFYVVAVDSPNTIDIGTVTYTATTGSIETDKIFGGLRDVDKDMESVTILGDDIDDDHTVQVYWQDDASETWELLGEVTESGQELRWDDYTTRPNTKAIKLGLVLNAKNSLIPTGTPVVRAIRLKYHNMVTDTFRWGLSIRVSDNQIMVDGVPNTYTAAQMITHLDAMTKQVAPIIFEDLDGLLYECKILNAQRNIDKTSWENGEKVTTYIYRLTIEQVTNGYYSV